MPRTIKGRLGFRFGLFFLLFVTLVLVGQVYPAFAQRTVVKRAVGPGCRLFQIKDVEKVLVISVLRVDLMDPFVKLESVLSRDLRSKRMTVTELCQSQNRPYHRVVGGINTDFFVDNLPVGIVVRDGELLNQGRGWSAIGFTQNKTPEIQVFDKDEGTELSQFRDIIGGGPRILRDGQVSVEILREGQREGFDTERHPRTAIGFSQGCRFLVLVVVDGRQPGYSQGMSLYELAELLLEFGCYDALNLDGGGSSTMVIRDRVVNSPSDIIGPRPVAGALLIISTSPHG